MSFRAPEKYRVTTGRLGSTGAAGNNGLFIIPAVGRSRPLPLRCICSDGKDWKDEGLPGPAWEHVSVSTHERCPTWEEMCLIVSLFWDAEDCVMQLHPPKSEWINQHPFCLHLWRPIGIEIPRPPNITVGV